MIPPTYLERSINTNTIVVDLVATTNHNMERLLLVNAQHIVPQTRPFPGIHISSNAEAIARMEHDAHAVVLGWHNELLCPAQWLVVFSHSHLRDIVLPRRLLLQEWHIDLVPPESLPGVLEQ
jgi:hypothetical protein